MTNSAARNAEMARDNCELCLGAKGGVRGNENRVRGIVMCDYCHALLMLAFKALESSPAEGDAVLQVSAEAWALCKRTEADAVSGLRYIEQRYGRLEGVGFDRVFEAHERLESLAPTGTGEVGK